MKSTMVRIYNRSPQMIAIQVRPPGSDFYTSEQQIRIGSHKDVTLPKQHVRMEQIQNLVARRMLQVTYDAESSP